MNCINIANANISKNNWDEIINLYKYEFFYLDPNKISTGISDEIFDAISTKMINYNNTINNKPINMNNLGSSIVLKINDSDKYIYIYSNKFLKIDLVIKLNYIFKII